MKNLFLSIAVAGLLASCSSVATSSKGKAQPSLSNTNWILNENVKGNTPTLTFADGKMNGNAGCNNYFGEVTLDTSTGNFSAGNVGSTRKMCENMSVEANYLQMISKVNKYVINGSTLELYKDNLLLLKFRKAD